MAVGKRAPQCALVALQPPAGLVDVDVRRAADLGQELVVGHLQRVAGALQDRLDAAGADPRREQLLAQLDDVTARDAVAHRQRHDGGLQARTEGAGGDLGGQRAALLGAAVGAAHALALVLDDAHRDRRQLLELMARRIADRDALGGHEHVPALAPVRPVLDDLVDGPRRQQRPPLALVTGLAALLATRSVLAAPRRRAGRILAGRLRGVARVAPQPALELRDALLLTGHTLGQPRDLLVHPQQHRDHRLTALVVDRLRLGALHTTEFAAAALCPADRLNAYLIR